MSSVLDDLFATDKTTEEDGAWVDVADGIRFKIRAYRAKQVVDLREKLAKPYQAVIRAGGEIPADKQEEIGLQVIAGAVLADWQGVKDATGEADLAYSGENALATLRRLPRMSDFIISISTDRQFYKDSLREESAGN